MVKSTWTVGDSSVAVTTDRGPWELDPSYLSRHEAAVTDAIDEVVAPELLDELVGDHIADLEADLGSEGDGETKEIVVEP